MLESAPSNRIPHGQSTHSPAQGLLAQNAASMALDQLGGVPDRHAVVRGDRPDPQPCGEDRGQAPGADPAPGTAGRAAGPAGHARGR
ncbi:hypothetical protein G6F32_013837 [Rhizopus arrhizus]|nr:hypothetical protein G6F32_013837 [Rhizopus arrhizus]